MAKVGLRPLALACCAARWSTAPVVVGQVSTEVMIGDENWLATQDRTCEGVWTDSRVGIYSSAAECKVECDLYTETHDEPCHSFAWCDDCTLTDCWICMYDPGPSSWRIVESEGVVLYQPRSVCPAGMAGDITATNVTDCLWCAAGWTAQAHQTKCSQCPIGKYAVSCGTESDTSCADAFFNSPNNDQSACPGNCLYRGGTTCVDCNSISTQACGNNGACHADGSDQKLSTEEIQERGCRCKDGWLGKTCDSEDGFRQVGVIAAIMAVILLCGCKIIYNCCTGKEGNTDRQDAKEYTGESMFTTKTVSMSLSRQGRAEIQQAQTLKIQAQRPPPFDVRGMATLRP